MTINRADIEASIRDVKEAVESPFFSGTFATAIASLIQAASESAEQGSDEKEKAVEALENAQMQLDEMESAFNRVWSHLSDADDAVSNLHSEWEDAKSEVEESLSTLRGY